MNKIYDFFHHQLNEMLLTTLPIEKAIYKITTDIYDINNNELYDEDYSISIEGKKIIIELKNNYNIDEWKYLLTTIYSTGYIISQFLVSRTNIKNKLIKNDNLFFKEINKKNIADVNLVCEPKWDSIIKTPEKIYHITDENNLENIKKYGLMPKSGLKKSYHPHRIYFVKLENVESITKSLRKQDIFSNKKNKYIVLEIDTKDLYSKSFNGELYKIFFYKDEHSEGFYTYDRILSGNIKIK